MPWHIVVPALILNGLETTACHSMVPDIVDDKKDMGNAIALNSMLFNSGRIAGPTPAGFVAAYTGEVFCFAADAFSYIVLI
ncbi:MAG: MFS transporter [Spirochaetia bacterium]|nr:MFS transporter [Spirochaetia bacterium]